MLRGPSGEETLTEIFCCGLRHLRLRSTVGLTPNSHRGSSNSYPLQFAVKAELLDEYHTKYASPVHMRNRCAPLIVIMWTWKQGTNLVDP